MPEKKEILEYLRNKQKEQEIDAKVNGINLWVLLGALALVIWQIIASINAPIWFQQDLILRVLLVTEAVYLATFFAKKRQGISGDIRYSSEDDEGSFELLFEAVLLFMPPALFVAVVDKRWSAIALLIFGMIFICIAISMMASGLTQGNGKKKFPDPTFGSTKRTNARFVFGFLAVLIAVIVDQSCLLWLDLSSTSVDSLKILTLVAAAFLLLLIAVRRRLRTSAVLWTYEMETDIVLGVISAKVALSRIENRALGSRVKDVMDESIEDIEKQFSELSSMLVSCRQDLASVYDIPHQYQAERTSRITNAAELPRIQIKKLISDISELKEYLDKLASPNRTKYRPDLLTLLESLAIKHKNYEKRVVHEKEILESLIIETKSVIVTGP